MCCAVAIARTVYVLKRLLPSEPSAKIYCNFVLKHFKSVFAFFFFYSPSTSHSGGFCRCGHLFFRHTNMQASGACDNLLKAAGAGDLRTTIQIIQQMLAQALHVAVLAPAEGSSVHVTRFLCNLRKIPTPPSSPQTKAFDVCHHQKTNQIYIAAR